MIRVHEHCPQTHFIHVGDREADVYDLFMATRPLGVDLRVRTAWEIVGSTTPNATCGRAWPPSLYVAGTLTLEVPRRGAQPARLPLDGTFWSSKLVSAALWKGFIGVTFGDSVVHLCCPMLAKKRWATDDSRPTLAWTPDAPWEALRPYSSNT